MAKLRVNEVFYSVQGEGVRAGTANVFVRFSGCNLACAKEEGPKSPGGFDCDTEFVSGRTLSDEELLSEMRAVLPAKAPDPGWCILTGGEPGLQVTELLVARLQEAGWLVAIETNGTVEVPRSIDWVTLSPKVAEHALKQLTAHELKYVRGYGQGLPKPRAVADNYLISPAFEGPHVDMRALGWCVHLVKENPQWRLSVQQHKTWQVR